MLQAFFWSGLAAAPLTYWKFRRRNLWPLYDNLRSTYTFRLGRGGLASGVYLLRMMAGGTQHIERMVIAH